MKHPYAQLRSKSCRLGQLLIIKSGRSLIPQLHLQTLLLSGLLNNSQFFTDLGEGSDTFIKVFTFVGG